MNNKIALYPASAISPRTFKVYTRRDFSKIPQIKNLSTEAQHAIDVVSRVLPFRVNEYVIDQLIDWSHWEQDPIFRLMFPQQEMLEPEDFAEVSDLIAREVNKAELQQAIDRIRIGLNPHPAGQMSMNVPKLGDKAIEGIQHKYKETVLFFPSQGQVCHSYCTFCFRWAQFIGDSSLRFASKEVGQLKQYLLEHDEVTDILFTGGDPMVMKTANLAPYVEALLSPELAHVQTVRIGTKALTFWPYRFVTDSDSDQLLALFERLIEAGKHVSIMAHYNHWRELDTPIAHEAIRRLRNSGVEIRSQGPLLKNINDNADIWQRMWQEQVRLGIVPYYMFVERDTGARGYFEVPLVKAWQIYHDAMIRCSGLARTARGPSMSTEYGKVCIEGMATIGNEQVMALKFLQSRDPERCYQPFFAKHDPEATWFDQLKPAFPDQAVWPHR